MASAALGDVPIGFRYSNYRDFDGAWFPTRVERVAGSFSWYELNVSAVRLNKASAFEVPAGIASNPVPPPATVEVTELAPGVFDLGGGSHNSAVVNQAGGRCMAPCRHARTSKRRCAIPEPRRT
jgi:hypothetical protein